MQITDFHAKYYARLLSQVRFGGTVESLAVTLQDASVDLIPHQIEAGFICIS